MIDHVWTVLCSRAVVDRATNNVSLQNVLEQIAVQGEQQSGELVPIPFQVATLWTRATPDMPCRGRMRLKFFAPSGKTYASLEAEIELSEVERYRNLMGFQGIPLEEAGRHVFTVELQLEDEETWCQVAVVPLTLEFLPPEEEPEPEVRSTRVPIAG